MSHALHTTVLIRDVSVPAMTAQGAFGVVQLNAWRGCRQGRHGPRVASRSDEHTERPVEHRQTTVRKPVEHRP